MLMKTKITQFPSFSGRF